MIPNLTRMCEFGEGHAWLDTETGEETPVHPNPSFRSMLRVGFEQAYLRPNYVSSQFR